MVDTEEGQRWQRIKIGDKPSIDFVLDEISRFGRTTEAHIQSPIWQNITLLLRDWNVDADERKMVRLLDRIEELLKDVHDRHLGILNRRLFLSSLDTVLRIPNLPDSLKIRGLCCRLVLGVVEDSTMMLVEDEEISLMAESLERRGREEMEENQKIAEQTRQIVELEARIALFEEERSLKRQIDELKQQLADLPIWVGTESLRSLDRTSHKLTPITLTQIIKLEFGCLRTAFTGPIDEGEWELKIRASETTFSNVSVFFSLLSFSDLGFLRHPLPENASQWPCGHWSNRIGGDFTLWSGRMWQGGEFKPAGTNKKCNRIGQTAAIRVNMRTREARLFVDDEEQPGIFTDIPSPLCLGITTGFKNAPIEVLWLKQLRS
ncbi:hypothetical protein BLNAU_12158 [Blattamonas nauphoetae]|uniref:Uncharacterized protein n=1 Tax=Blattamonas nauphoetae TaxID=2049346 RepID=A0ABQ9XK83_9EUKA|nr:hypothetical protein BLNAU_12158 [Blattamonas nauphoetae]